MLITASQNDRHFRLTVQDAGGGGAPEFVPELFERFARSVDTRLCRGPASGSRSRARTRRRTGDLFYEPAASSGARFQLVLPRR